MRADRVVSMMLLLQSRGRMSAAALARELEVSRRTVMRDLEALGAAGVPVFSTRGPDGGFEIWDGFRSVLSTITGEEAAALALLGVPEGADALGMNEPLRRVSLKLAQSMPRALADEMADLESVVYVDPTPLDGEVPVAALRFLMVAIRRRRVIRSIVGDRAETELEPLGLVHRVGDWHLVAVDVADRGVRAVRVTTMHGYGTTGRRFERPQNFDLKGFWSRTGLSAVDS